MRTPLAFSIAQSAEFINVDTSFVRHYKHWHEDLETASGIPGAAVGSLRARPDFHYAGPTANALTDAPARCFSFRHAATLRHALADAHPGGTREDC